MAKRNVNNRKRSVQGASNGKGAKDHGSRGKLNSNRSTPNSSDAEGVKYSNYNDVSWYAKNEKMLRDAASFSYNRPLGAQLPWNELFTGSTAAGGTTLNFTDSSDTIPGIMVYDTMICPGLSLDQNSPINLAAQNIYSYVRYMNSGAKNYDAPDLMMYLLVMDSAYALFNSLKRVYGVVQSFSQRNWYIPKGYSEAFGIDLEDVRMNLSDFRLFLNTMAAQLTSFCVPAVFPIFVRHSWLYSNIYKDSDNEKSQLYIINPVSFYRYNETAGAGRLEQLQWFTGTGKRTASNVMGFAQAMVNWLIYSEDVGIMSGDILKAYGQDKLFKITGVDPDYQVVPVYNEEVLNQIHNATILGIPYTAFAYPNNNSFAITQDVDTNALIYNPSWGATSIDRNGVFVNMPWDEVTPANTMVGTRLSASTRVENNKQYFQSVGSDFVAGARYIKAQYDSNHTLSYVSKNFTTQMILARQPNNEWQEVITGVQTLADIMCNLSNFDWHPLVFVWVGTTTGAGASQAFTLVLSGVLGDVSNYTFIHNSDLEQMHLTALMSEFNIPQLGSF